MAHDAPSSLVRLDLVSADPAELLGREWLETNGTGAYAAGTIALASTRRYHGLLVAPPPGSARRHVFLSRFEERLHLPAADPDADAATTVELSAAQYGDVLVPRGHELLRRFELAPHPRFTYRAGDVEVVREVLLARGQPAVLVRWSVRGAEGPVRLELLPLLAFRDADALTVENADLDPAVEPVPGEVPTWRVRPYDALPALTLSVGVGGGDPAAAALAAEPTWYRRVTYRADEARGYAGTEELFCPGGLVVELADGADVVVAAALDGAVEDPRGTWRKQRAARRRRVQKACGRAPRVAGLEEVARRSSVAADDFLYETAGGRTAVDAGYPWFGEWGRDAFIALPGLTLARGRTKDCARALSGAVEYLRDGLLPNIFGLSAADSHYGSIDAALWFARCVRLYEQHDGSRRRVLKEYLPALLEVAEGTLAGTPLSDPVDEHGLVRSGSDETNATWMDARTPAGPVTPRAGYAVEINALWYSLLHQLEYLCDEAGRDADRRRWHELRRTAREAFLERFWVEDGGYLADVWTPEEVDARVRPNMVIAAALEWSPLSREQRARVVDRARSDLLTPRGLRTLAPDAPGYVGVYAGGPEERDAAYHQGTVWPWLLGFLVEASLRAHGPGKAQRKLLAGLWGEVATELDERGLNHLSEVFGGDPPHAAGGTFAQAWNTAELLRSLHLLEHGLP